MKTLLIATQKPFASAAIDLIKPVIARAGYTLHLLEKYEDKQQLINAATNVDAMIVRSDKVDAEVLNAAKNLKIVVRAGAGYDNVDVKAATEAGVCVMNTPGQNSNAVAELAAAFLVMGARKMFSGDAGNELRGKRLGLHGYGYISRNLHRITSGFGMDCVVYTKYSKPQAISEGIEVASSLEDLYAKSDMVSIHVPARGEHIASVSYDVLKHLKDGAVIVNTARKEVINEDDLIRIMDEKPNTLFLADVAPEKAEVFKEKFAKRVFISPKKLGAQTAEANINAGVAAAEQIVRFFEEGDCGFQVN